MTDLASNWSAERVAALALETARNPGAFELLSNHEGRAVYRCPQPDATTVVIKLWARAGLKGAIRRGLRASTLDHEWKSLCRARDVGVRVPTPLGRSALPANPAGHTAAMVSADLGPCVTAVDHLKRLIASGAEPAAAAFEREIVLQTGLMIDGGLLDTDHGLVNTLVPGSGAPTRLDFEMARIVRWPRLHPTAYGAMLGHLLATHAFAVQPATERTVRFATALVERLGPPHSVLRRARTYVDRRMVVQEQRIGLAVRVALPW